MFKDGENVWFKFRDFAFPVIPFRMSQAIEKEGRKSVNGKISSARFNTLPIFPTFPPKVFRKMKADKGAQITSVISPRTGMLKLA